MDSIELTIISKLSVVYHILHAKRVDNLSLFLKSVIIGLVLLGSLTTSGIADSLFVKKGMRDLSMGSYWDYHISSTSDDDDIDMIMSPEFRDKFQTQDANVPNFGFNTNPIWLRTVLINQDSKNFDWIIYLTDAHLANVTMYLFHGDSLLSKVVTGEKVPIPEREVDHRFFVFPISLPYNQPITAVLRIQSHTGINLPISLWNPTAFAIQEQRVHFAWGILYGLLSIMVVYNLFLFFVLKDIAYFYYVLRIGATLLLLASINGLSYQYLWPYAVAWNELSMGVLMAVCLLAATQFTRHYLQIETISPRLEKYLISLMAIASVLIVLQLFNLTFAFSLTLYLAIAVVLGMIAAGYLGFKAKFRPAYYFILAENMVVVGALIKAITALTWLPSTWYTEYSLHIGVAFQTVLLSFGLADRISMLRRKTMQAQQELELEKVERQRQELEHEYEIDREHAKAVEANLKAKAAELQAKAVESENRRKSQELEQAKQFQRQLLPTSSPKNDLVDIATYHQTASEVGGDYYDFIVRKPGEITGVIGDATGHGLPASLMVAVTKSALFAINSDDLENTATQMNRTLTSIKMDRRMFMAMCLYRIEKVPGHKFATLSLVGGGIPPMYVLRQQTGEVEEFLTQDIPLGLQSKFKYSHISTKVFPGDFIVVCSDGLPERNNANNELYGYHSINETLATAYPEPELIASSESLLLHIVSNMELFAGDSDPDDDVTIVVLRVK